MGTVNGQYNVTGADTVDFDEFFTDRGFTNVKIVAAVPDTNQGATPSSFQIYDEGDEGDYAYFILPVNPCGIAGNVSTPNAITFQDIAGVPSVFEAPTNTVTDLFANPTVGGTITLTFKFAYKSSNVNPDTFNVYVKALDPSTFDSDPSSFPDATFDDYELLDSFAFTRVIKSRYTYVTKVFPHDQLLSFRVVPENDGIENRDDVLSASATADSVAPTFDVDVFTSVIVQSG